MKRTLSTDVSLKSANIWFLRKAHNLPTDFESPLSWSPFSKIQKGEILSWTKAKKINVEWTRIQTNY